MFNYRLDWVTMGIIVANILYFIYEIMQLGTGLIATRVTVPLDFASVGGLNAHTDFLSYITSMFAHASVAHILMNMLALASIGYLVYDSYGSIYYLLSYFITGLGANILSVVMMPETTTVGASGAIFGMFGMYVIAALFEQGFVNFTNAVVSVGFSFASGFMMPQVNMWAHGGGLVIGLILGLIFMLIKKLGQGVKSIATKSHDHDTEEPRMYY